jgi:hypothetical protein
MLAFCIDFSVVIFLVDGGKCNNVTYEVDALASEGLYLNKRLQAPTQKHLTTILV